MSDERVASGSPYEETVGFSRAVRTGRHVYVSGTAPKTRVLRTEDCYPNTGYGGFDIDVTRHFHLPSDPTQDHDEVMHTTYTPSDTVICRPPR